jgi:hypothetical protein
MFEWIKCHLNISNYRNFRSAILLPTLYNQLFTQTHFAISHFPNDFGLLNTCYHIENVFNGQNFVEMPLIEDILASHFTSNQYTTRHSPKPCGNETFSKWFPWIIHCLHMVNFLNGYLYNILIIYVTEDILGQPSYFQPLYNQLFIQSIWKIATFHVVLGYLLYSSTALPWTCVCPWFSK